MIVYLARNRTNGKAYVGKTKRSLEQRTKEHLMAARSGADQLFGRALCKHGPEAFDWRVLVGLPVGSSEDDLDAAERAMIAEHRTYVHDHPDTGYNLTRGGEGVRGLVHTPETRARMSEARKGELNYNFGKQWGRKGPHSAETKQKMREAAMGRKHTSETRAKISASQYVAVVQLDMSGNHVATYSSMLEAERATNCGRQGISRACRMPGRSCGGYRWHYAE